MTRNLFIILNFHLSIIASEWNVKQSECKLTLYTGYDIMVELLH